MNTTGQKSFITVLKGNKSSHKVFNYINGEVIKTSDHAYSYDSVTQEVSSVEDIFNVIKETITDNRKFIIRGRGKFETQFDVQRRKEGDEAKFFEAPTAWVCFDFDKIETPHDPNSIDAIEYIISHNLPEEFHHATYVLQWSSSAGVAYNGTPVKTGTSAHLFFYLSQGLTQYQLESWFVDNQAVDPAVFRTVQPIFINPFAEFKGDGFTSSIPDDQKISLITKAESFVVTPDETILSRVKEKTYKPRQHSASSSVRQFEAEFNDDILNALAPYMDRTYRDTINLWSPREQSKGGYYVYRNNPTYVYHASGDKEKYAKVDEWLKYHHGVDFEIPTKPLWTKVSSAIDIERAPDTIDLNERFLPRDIIPLNDNQVIFLRSPKGSGKTEAMIEFVEQCRKQNKSVCLIGHRVRLLESQANRVNLTYYREIDESNIRERYIAICINSLKRLDSHVAFTAKYDVVIIDESEQVFSHFTQKTIDRQPRKELASLFYNILSNSKTVLVADADLTDLTITIVGEACKDHDYLAIDNTYKSGKGQTIEMYEDNKTFINECLLNAQEKKTIYYCSNTKARVDRMYAMFVELDIPCFKITSDNSDSPEAHQLLRTLSSGHKSPYQVVLASPSVSTGVDIQTSFDFIYGDFGTNITTHYDMDQQVHRVRNCENIKVYIDKRQFRNNETDPEQIRHLYLTNDKKTQSIHDLVSSSIQDQAKPWWNWLLTIKCMVEAHYNQSIQTARDNYKALKRSQGYQVITNVVEFDGEIEEVETFDFEATKERIKRAPKLTLDEFEFLKDNKMTQEHDDAILRYWIETFFRTDVIDDDSVINLWFDNKYKKQQRAFESFYSDFEEWELIDRLENRTVHTIDKSHATQKQLLLRAGYRILGLIDSNDSFNQEFAFSKDTENTKQFQSWCEGLSKADEKILGITVSGYQLKQGPARVIDSFITLCGLKTEQVGFVRTKSKNKIYTYGLNLEHLKLLNHFRELRTADKKGITPAMLKVNRLIEEIYYEAA